MHALIARDRETSAWLKAVSTVSVLAALSNRPKLTDAWHAVSCATGYNLGYNLRWLLRAITRLGIGPLFLRLLQAALSLAQAIRASHGRYGRTWVRD